MGYSGPGIAEQPIPDAFLNTGIAIANMPGDDSPPSAPSGLTERSKSTHSIGLSWNASTDNVGVTGYDIFHKYGPSSDSLLLSTDAKGKPLKKADDDDDDNGNENINSIEFTSFQGTTTEMTLLAEPQKTVSALIRDLEPGTTYAIYIRARDAAGNISLPSETIESTTEVIEILPIELKSFSAKYSPRDRNVLLQWVTSSETNNSFFTIERAIADFSFEPVGTVDGAGNSNDEIAYSFTDDYSTNGVVYYRLKQTDFDGKFKYSKATAAAIENPELADLILYPNPSSGKGVTIVLKGQENTEKVRISITDLIGKQVFKSEHAHQDLRYGAEIIFGQKLVPGIYIVVVEYASKVLKTKLIVKDRQSF